MKLDAARWWDQPGIRDLLNVLGAKDGLIRFVGGTVRDELLGIPHADVDLATRLEGEAVLELVIHRPRHLDRARHPA